MSLKSKPKKEQRRTKRKIKRKSDDLITLNIST